MLTPRTCMYIMIRTPVFLHVQLYKYMRITRPHVWLPAPAPALTRSSDIHIAPRWRRGKLPRVIAPPVEQSLRWVPLPRQQCQPLLARHLPKVGVCVPGPQHHAGRQQRSTFCVCSRVLLLGARTGLRYRLSVSPRRRCARRGLSTK